MKSAGIASSGRHLLEIRQRGTRAGRIETREEGNRRLPGVRSSCTADSRRSTASGTRRAGIFAARRPKLRARLGRAAADHDEVLRHRPSPSLRMLPWNPIAAT